jgi:hypothetical protein
VTLARMNIRFERVLSAGASMTGGVLDIVVSTVHQHSFRPVKFFGQTVQDVAAPSGVRRRHEALGMMECHYSDQLVGEPRRRRRRPSSAPSACSGSLSRLGSATIAAIFERAST